MKNIIIILLIAFCNNSIAQKIAVSGENISADKFNSSSSQIGEIKQALLTQAEFQQLNGDCWVEINGQDIGTSDYAAFTGRNILPNAAGRFLRNSGGSAAPLAEVQEDEFKSHNHTITRRINTALASTTLAAGRSDQGSTDSNASTNFTGGAETRPKNLTVNYFIKINKNCNFN